MASSSMIDTAVGTIVRIRKISRGYTYEEIMIRIPRILCRNIGKSSLLFLPYRPPAGTKGRRKTG